MVQTIFTQAGTAFTTVARMMSGLGSIAAIVSPMLLALGVFCTPARAQTLEQARASYFAVDFRDARRAFRAIVARPDASSEEKVEAHRYLAVLESALGHEAAGRMHVRRALELDSRAGPPEGAPPWVAQMFSSGRVGVGTPLNAVADNAARAETMSNASSFNSPPRVPARTRSTERNGPAVHALRGGASRPPDLFPLDERSARRDEPRRRWRWALAGGAALVVAGALVAWWRIGLDRDESRQVNSTHVIGWEAP